MQTVKLLPDTPPPPPPKPEEKKPEPPKEDKAQPQLPAPKAAEQPPQPQALKTDEAAGTGPGNGMVAGAVTRDYSDQKIGGSTIGGNSDAGPSLALANSFANGLARSLNEFLARDRELRRADYRARVLVWLSPQGALQRVELVEGTGDAQTDEALRSAIRRFPGAATQPPERLPQPLRLQVTNRMIG
jgi:TonB family protein